MKNGGVMAPETPFIYCRFSDQFKYSRRNWGFSCLNVIHILDIQPEKRRRREGGIKVLIFRYAEAINKDQD